MPERPKIFEHQTPKAKFSLALSSMAVAESSKAEYSKVECIPKKSSRE